MRANYAASLAAVSVTGYITGAGDRHLENFLMHTASGTLIPIDFGYDVRQLWTTPQQSLKASQCLLP